MIQFNKLRLSGFKSFVEPTELLVEPGLTGVVGPNGCGKSNLVEAMRWVMGETSAKQMRGGEMDDVIFSGTRNRPARNVAEVSLTLDNRARTAPAPLNTADELEVSRRIDRGGGSTYRVNGKEVRARDVQLLFADAATGARSTAIVSQGRIGALIAAAPAERRALLEEAAGISGLHSRRHEAELRLRGAENNLSRLDDVLAALAQQKQSLDRQVRQATRYRALSGEIRALEVALTRRNWDDAQAAAEAARQSLAEAEAKVAETAQTAAEAATRQADAFAAVDPARQAATAAETALHRLIVARESLEEDERRLERAFTDNALRLAQADGDLTRAATQHADAERRLAEIAAERLRLTAEEEHTPAATARIAARLTETEAARQTAERELTAASTALAETEAAAKAAARIRAEAQTALDRIAGRIRQIDDQIAAAAARRVPAERLAAAETRLNETEASVAATTTARDGAEATRGMAESAAKAATAAFAQADAEHRRLLAEIEALHAVIEGGDAPAATQPVLNRVRAEAGFEAAAAALLEHGADAPEDDAAKPPPRAWRTLPPLETPPPPPADFPPLSHHVEAPAALARRLSLAFLVGDAATGDSLAARLAPGQCLLDRDGGLWRWDGFVVRPGAPSAAAVRLQQANRLRERRAALPDLSEARDRAMAAREASDAAAKRAEADERAARDAARAADAALAEARTARDRLLREDADAADRLQRFADSRQSLEAERAEAAALAAASDDGGATRIPELALAAANARTQAETARAQALDARAAADADRRDAEQRRARLKALETEDAAWTDRLRAAAEYRDTLAERRHDAEAEREALRAQPQALEDRRAALSTELETAERLRRDTADALAIAESALRAADARMKEADHAATTAREDRVRAEAQVDRRAQACDEIAARCREFLGCAVADIDTAGTESFLDMPSAEIAERIDRRAAERERLGPVNLRAEIEAEDVGKQIDGLTAERGDLLAAIARLRQGIAELNREGRDRLQKSFETVNRAFQDIFTDLFGGGRAYLNLVENDDPLAAGIEIMASPPGKRLQLLSLLSGGEQALTALALLFAVFRSNPAPICILDEVDAPLDDANVDRFCGLLSAISGKGLPASW